jgi:hypothetical protein
VNECKPLFGGFTSTPPEPCPVSLSELNGLLGEQERLLMPWAKAGGSLRPTTPPTLALLFLLLLLLLRASVIAFYSLKG